MGENYLQFAAVLAKVPKYNMKLDKTGKSYYDKKYEAGKLSSPMGKKVCHCFFNNNEFYAVGFDVQHSAALIPIVPVSFKTRKEIGEQFIHFKLSEVIDYKRMQSLIDGKRLVINTINYYLHIRPVTDSSVDQPLRNRKLICKIHEQYERMGIRSAGSSGYTAKYDEPFLGWLHKTFGYYTHKGYIKRKPGFRQKVCAKHKRTGRFVPEYKAFYCEKCKDYIR